MTEFIPDMPYDDVIAHGSDDLEMTIIPELEEIIVAINETAEDACLVGEGDLLLKEGWIEAFAGFPELVSLYGSEDFLNGLLLVNLFECYVTVVDEEFEGGGPGMSGTHHYALADEDEVECLLKVLQQINRQIDAWFVGSQGPEKLVKFIHDKQVRIEADELTDFEREWPHVIEREDVRLSNRIAYWAC